MLLYCRMLLYSTMLLCSTLLLYSTRMLCSTMLLYSIRLFYSATLVCSTRLLYSTRLIPNTRRQPPCFLTSPHPVLDTHPFLDFLPPPGLTFCAPNHLAIFSRFQKEFDVPRVYTPRTDNKNMAQCSGPIFLTTFRQVSGHCPAIFWSFSCHFRNTNS